MDIWPWAILRLAQCYNLYWNDSIPLMAKWKMGQWQHWRQCFGTYLFRQTADSAVTAEKRNSMGDTSTANLNTFDGNTVGSTVPQ